jgi:hypothetical protein
MPEPVRLTTLIYFGSLLSWNTYFTYMDSKKCLELFRNNKITELGKEGVTNFQIANIKTDWDAVLFGATMNSGERLWDSIWWPLTAIQNIIPAIVLFLNKK